MKRQIPRLIAIAGLALLLVAIAGKAIVSQHQSFQARAQTACLSHTKQLAMAMRTYAADHDARLPSTATWCDDLTPDLRSDQDFICPLGPDARSTYAMNRWMDEVQIEGVDPESPYDETAGTIPDPASGQAVDPAEVVLILEGPGGWNQAGGPDEVRYRHNGGANFGFADAHVKWSRSDRVHEWRWPQKLAPDPDRDSAQ